MLKHILIMHVCDWKTQRLDQRNESKERRHEIQSQEIQSQEINAKHYCNSIITFGAQKVKRLDLKESRVLPCILSSMQQNN